MPKADHLKDNLKQVKTVYREFKGECREFVDIFKGTKSMMWLRDTFKSLIYALLIAGLFRTLLFEPYIIPSGSMKPNFLVGDYLFVSKYRYGYSTYSLPFALNMFEGRYFGDSPKRGEVIVFRNPKNPSTFWIKRLVGIGGDTVQMKKGILYVNDIAVTLTAAGRFIDDDNGDVIQQYQETDRNGKEYLILDQYAVSQSDNTPKYTIPKDHLFFMGDNRDNSNDSRGTLGMVHQDYVIGKAEIIVISVSGTIKDMLKPGRLLRFDRFFKLVS